MSERPNPERPSAERPKNLLGKLLGETKTLYIARPDSARNNLIYLHPDKSIPRGAKLTVRASECALFFREGQFVGRIDDRSVQLDTANIPFLGHVIVDSFTGGNHFICEIFFVSLNEVIVDTPIQMLGQYRDLNSARVVSILGQLSLTIKINDPRKLIVELGGQNWSTGESIENVLIGRVFNQLRRVVGKRSQARPVLDLVSNVDAEAISDEVRDVTNAEFGTLGLTIGRLFDLSLSLDQESLNSLRTFGDEESKLAIQAKGAELARQDGFAQFNLIQGQRNAMDGLGAGLSKGNSPAILTGLNVGGAFGGNFGGMGMRPVSRPPAGVGSTILSGQAAFLMLTSSGETGPYSARQIALMMISKGQPLSACLLRRSDDPPDVTFTADLEPAIMAEYSRRTPARSASPAPAAVATPPAASPPQTPPSASVQAFDMALTASAASGVLGAPTLTMMTRMALTLGLASDEPSGVAFVRAAAERLGLRVEAER